jgi:peptidoglycan/LPS O-acetylase OafA/YrhL
MGTINQLRLCLGGGRKGKLVQSGPIRRLTSAGRPRVDKQSFWIGMTAVPPKPAPSGVRRWPAFDGLRAVAILSVMAYHLEYHDFLRGGYVGVDVFFVLSGFLITWLLTTEVDRLGGISLGKFYARRALRLFPALGLTIVASLLLVMVDGAFAGGYRHESLVALPFVVLYIGNWRAAFSSLYGLGIFGVTWSLAIEEQFYLFWPLGLARLLKVANRQKIALGLVAVAGAEMVVRAIIDVSSGSWVWAYMSTFTHSDGLLLGSAIALLWTVRTELKPWALIERYANQLGVLGVAVLAVVIFLGSPDPHQMAFWMPLAVVATAAILVSVAVFPQNVLSTILQWRPLQWVGKRSYGCYLYHAPIFVLVDTLSLPNHHVRIQRFVIDFAATFVVAALSYRYLEKPFLNRKTRFSRITVEVAPQ